MISRKRSKEIGHARYLSAKLRAQLPHAKIVVGIWGATENMAGAGERLRSSGADEVVVSLAEAVVQLAKFSVSIADKMIPGAIPDNEEDRLEELARLHDAPCRSPRLQPEAPATQSIQAHRAGFGE